MHQKDHLTGLFMLSVALTSRWYYVPSSCDPTITSAHYKNIYVVIIQLGVPKWVEETVQPGRQSHLCVFHKKMAL